MAGNEDVDDPDAPKKAFKCCKTKGTTIVVCVNCGNVYHRSCIKRDLPEIINIKGDVRFECCKSKVVRPEEDIKKLKYEKEMLERLLKESDEKYKLLLENNKLLKDNNNLLIKNNQVLEEKIVTIQKDSHKNEDKNKKTNKAYSEVVK